MGKKRHGLETERQGWEHLVLVCRKCSKKLDGGFGEDGEDTLRSELRRAFRKTRLRRSVRVLEVGCLSVCPKDAVSVVTSAAPSMVLIVPAGTQAEQAAASVQEILGSHGVFKTVETSR